MSKILDWIKKHVWQTVLIGFGLFFLPLILVHVAYRIPATSPWFASTWEAGELITYIAGFEAFLGTVALGGATVYLNRKANEINTKLLDHEKKRTAFERQPEIAVKAGNSEIITLANLYKYEYPFYYYADALPQTRDRNMRMNHQLGLYTIYLEPNKNYNLFLFSFDLKLHYLTPSSVVETINYEKKPDPYGLYSRYIRDGSYPVYFILDKKVIDESRSITGTMTLSLSNSGNNKYFQDISFKLIVDDFESENDVAAISIEIKEFYTRPILE